MFKHSLILSALVIVLFAGTVVVSNFKNPSGSTNPNVKGISIVSITPYFNIKSLIPKFPTSATTTSSALTTECTQSKDLERALKAKLGNSLKSFTLRKVTGDAFTKALKDGSVTYPLVNEKGKLVDVKLAAKPYSILSPDATTGYIKGRDGKDQRVTLPQVTSYRLGLCSKDDLTCGTLTMLDANKTQFEGYVLNKQVGFTFFEPVDNLLVLLGDKKTKAEPGCHVFYNSAQHEAIPFFDDDPVVVNTKESFLPTVHADDVLTKTIPIELDSDATFYQLNTNTVWSRQLSILSGVSLIYNFIEPLSNGNFNINFLVKGQETWLPGYGPTTTNHTSLTNEINDADYYMINHPDKNELSFFFVGYDVTDGYAGEAGGVCNVAGYDDTFGSDEDHQDNHAWGQQILDSDGGYQFSTLYGRMIASGHEIAHMLGGTHGDGSANTCAAGLLNFVCGSSIMKSGAAGGIDPDLRKPFFTPKNSKNIVKCVKEAN